MIFFKPRWVKLVNQSLPPGLISDIKIKKMENIRSKYDIPHELFALGIMATPATTKMIQRYIYNKVKERMPEASEKGLLKEVLKSRALPPEPYGYGMTEAQIDIAMASINSLDNLTEYIISKEPRSQTLKDFSEIGQMVGDILKE